MSLDPTPGMAGREAGPRTCLSGFGRDQSGTTAIEFSLVALPFLALVGGILELGMTAWARSALQDAVTATSRQIYTGRFQTENAAVTDSGVMLSKFRDELCKQTGALVITLFCHTAKISIRQADSAGQASLAPTSGTANGWNPDFSSYAPGPAGSIVVIQAAIEFPILFSLLGPGEISRGVRIVQGTAVIKVEPYGAKPQ